jgi:nitroimidazol reductase NimA-like FMN-containing flavoprotein (pyridoxamine 5'-phosphate oxidase superfamily)
MSARTDGPIEQLTERDCRELMSAAGLEWLAVRVGEGVDIFPLNFLVKDQATFFSSAPGSKMIDATAHPHVALEADGIHSKQTVSMIDKVGASR